MQKYLETFTVNVARTMKCLFSIQFTILLPSFNLSNRFCELSRFCEGLWWR